MEEIDVKKTKYFVIAIIILIILGILLIIHFNNKEMVNGDIKENKTTEITTTTITTMTKKVTTTKKVKVEEMSNTNVEPVYKSTVDSENGLVFNYKLNNEITNDDRLISKKMDINEKLKSSNIIGLFDISLYDINLNKKEVNNTLINIKIPLKDELVGYDEYKIVYINDNNQITNETFDVKVSSDYIEFNTTHLSLYGVVGIKNIVEEKEVIDLSNVSLDVKINGVKLEDTTNILLINEDKIDFVVNNINYEYDVYYALKNNENVEYKLYTDKLDLVNGDRYKLIIKIVVEDTYKVFEVGNIGLYDEIFTYDRNQELKETNVGFIETEEKSETPYVNKDINKDIVIDYIEKEETEESTTNKEDSINSANNALDLNNEGNNGASEDNDTNSSNEIIDNSATIKVNGNIYLVEKTDISELEMTGYLYIDTKENIKFKTDSDGKLETSKLYMIIIRNNEFMLNDKKYKYEYIGEDIVIKLIENEIETDVTNSFANIFQNNYKVWGTQEGLNIANPAQ